MKSMELGDMTVVGQPAPRLVKALAVVTAHLHRLFEQPPEGGYAYDSRRSCIIASLAVRDFLFRIGYRDAEVRPVTTLMKAEMNGEEMHSLVVGHPEDRGQGKGHWGGHLVVCLPSDGFIVDTTLYPAIRQQWTQMKGMFAVPIYRASQKLFGLVPLTGFEQDDGEGYRYTVVWLDNPSNRSWKVTNDAKLKRRRAHVIAGLVHEFGDWS